MMISPDPTTGERIRKMRLSKGISQRQLAEPGVTYAYISRLEQGDRHPSWTALIYLAEKLETNALYLGTGRANGPCPVCGRS